VAILAVVLAGCGEAPTASLRISLRNTVGTNVRLTTWTLRCNPDSGSAPSPSMICARLRSDRELLNAKEREGHSCPVGSPFLSVVGTYDGTPIRRVFSPCLYGADGVEEKWLNLLRVH
jgi:hypothetical protein